jgi:predicted Ser/Thr protein kinase
VSTPESGDALQEARDKVLGQKAVERGWITPEQLADALAEQSPETAARRSKPRPLGNILASKGYLSDGRLVLLLEEEKAAAFALHPEKNDTFPVSFGKYSLLRELGRGGMGVVYEALDTVLHRKVALKLVLSDSEEHSDQAREEAERFMREARLSANLSKHAHIVGVYDAGVIDGRCYLTMEYIEGQPMSKWRKSGSAALRDQIPVLRDVARAVHHAHEQGIIHRDLKPDNILLDARHQPHVTDFGLAKSLDPGVTASLTAQGKVMGTPVYMSPEQAQGLPTVDHRTDIYSMGVMIYESLTGRPPFTADTPVKLLMKVVNDPVPPPSKVLAAGAGPLIDARLEEICLKAMAKDPEKRHPTATALAEDLDQWQGSATVPGPAVPQAPLPRKRSGRRLAAALVVLLLAGGAACVYLGLTPIEKSLGLARILSWIGRDEQALALYEAILRQDPSNVQAARGREALRGRDPAKEETPSPAKAIPERAQDGSPVHPAAKTGKEAAPARTPASIAATHRGPVDETFVNAAQALPPEDQIAAVLRKLKELNPDYGGKARHKLENGKVTDVTLLSSALSDLTPIRILPGLKYLDIVGEVDPGAAKSSKGLLADLSPLRGLALRRLRVPNNPLRDLSPLRGMPLTQLDCDGTEVADLAPLKGMALTWLDLGNTPVVDLAPLKEMPLEFLVLSGTGVTDLSPLMGMPLKKLFLLKTKVTDFSPLKNCPLAILRIPYVAERDAALVRSIKTLEEINNLPAAEFLSKYGHPWLALYDGRSTEMLLLEPKAGWSLDKGILTSSGPDCVLVTREEFEDGEFRIRFRSEGITFLSIRVRQALEKGYAVLPDLASLGASRGKTHEVIFSCREDQISATLDGLSVPLKYRNGPRRGPMGVHVMGGHLSILSIDHR